MPEAIRFFWQFNLKPDSNGPECRFRQADLQFRVRPMDYYAFQEIILDHEYGFIRPLLAESGPGSMIVDIGANIGLFAIYALSIAAGAKVHSFEPASSTFRQLSGNRESNQGYDWTIHQLAMWREAAELTFQSSEYSTGGRVSGTGIGSEIVKAIDLPFLLSNILEGKSIDLMKVDIEGAEEAFLSGMGPRLGGIANLIIEIHPGICDHLKTVRELGSSFPYIHEIPGRQSSKPLLLCSRKPRSLPLFKAG